MEGDKPSSVQFTLSNCCSFHSGSGRSTRLWGSLCCGIQRSRDNIRRRKTGQETACEWDEQRSGTRAGKGMREQLRERKRVGVGKDEETDMTKKKEEGEDRGRKT